MCWKKNFAIGVRLRRLQRAYQVVLQNKICFCKKTKTVRESLRSFVAKRNLVEQKHSDALRELTKSCWKKKFAVAKRLRCLQIAYEVLLQKQICCWKKTSTVSQTLPSCVAKRNFLVQKHSDFLSELTKLFCEKKFAVVKRLKPLQRAYQVVLQKQICCCKKTSTLLESLPSFVGKRNLLLQKHFDTFRELTKLCCKKKLAVGKRVRGCGRAYEVVLEKEIFCWKKT